MKPKRIFIVGHLGAGKGVLAQALAEKLDWKYTDADFALAHKMKGGTVYCGTVKMQYAYQYLERYRKAGYRQQLGKLHQQLIQVTKQTRVAITDWLNKN